jgi:ribosomal protein L11 methylase PrmA
LIDRPETEAYTTHLAELLINGSLDEQLFSRFKRTPPGRGRRKAPSPRNELNILDVCSGSGCISLLLHSLLSKSKKFPNIKTLGLDISPKAVALADENLAFNISRGHLPALPRSKEQDEELKQALQSKIPGYKRRSHLKGHKLLQYLKKQKVRE